ncbi:MAG: DinB family protein [Acidimicrobiales bacterium]
MSADWTAQAPAARWLARLAAAEARLGSLGRQGRRLGLTTPDPGGEERWQDAQVWAHLAEFPRYWTEQLQRVLNGPPPQPVPFGRTKSDPGRRAAVAAARPEEVGRYLSVMLVGCGRLRDLLSAIGDAGWERRGVHPSLGEMDVGAILEEFLVGHLEEHAAQLETLAPEAP